MRLGRDDLLVATSADHVVQHAVPDLLHDADLLLDGFRSGSQEVGDGVEVDTVSVAVMRVGDGQDDGEGRCADDFGSHDGLGKSQYRHNSGNASILTYHFGLRRDVGCSRVVREDGYAHHESAACRRVVRVEVGKVGKVDGGGVVDLLESAGGVEVADGCGRSVLLSSGTLRLLDSGAESTRASDLVGREAGDELWRVSNGIGPSLVGHIKYLLLVAAEVDLPLLALVAKTGDVPREVQARALLVENGRERGRAGHVKAADLVRAAREVA